MKIATWNVNSIKARLPLLLAWLGAAKPDVVLLQELKCQTEAVPREPIEDLGYNVAAIGQKTYNGVAILARRPIEDVTTALPGDPADEAARYIEGFVDSVRVVSVYVPNGQEVGSQAFAYKLAFLDRLHQRAKDLLKLEETLVIGGDLNVAPEDIDVYDPAAWAGQVLCHPKERQRLRRLMHLGFTDAYRALHGESGAYSWWDYRANAFARDQGLRIDHLLLSPQAADRLSASGIEKGPRGEDKASDHTPVWCELHPARKGKP